jgi:hypothetical protein
MLTLIVVTAATAFAIFTSQKQKEIQDADLYNTQRNLEQIEILGIEQIIYDTTTGNLINISFNIGSMHAKDSLITSLSLNGYLLKNFNLTRQNLSSESWKLNFTTGIYEKVGIGSDIYYPLTILAHERVILTIDNVTINNTSWSLLKPKNVNITANDPLQCDISTNLVNTFSKTFIPPTAIIQIVTESQWNSTGLKYEPFLILDGSLSDHPGSGQIIRWDWTFNHTILPLSGRKIRAPDELTDGTPYTITLMVTDLYGMSGSASINYP